MKPTDMITVSIPATTRGQVIVAIGGTTSQPQTSSIDDCGPSSTNSDAPAYVRRPLPVQYNRAHFIEEMLDVAIRDVFSDIINQVVPSSVASFEDLHDHVDANMYGLGVIEPLLDAQDDGALFREAIDEIANPVQEFIHKLLVERRKFLNGIAARRPDANTLSGDEG